MRRYDITATVFAAAVAFSASYACAQEFTAKLSGFNEIGSIPTTVTVTTLGTAAPTSYTGAILTDATGTLKLDLDKKAGQFTYTLTYTGPFTSDVQQAHIHFGKSRDSGGIVVWLCQTTAKPRQRKCLQSRRLAQPRVRLQRCRERSRGTISLRYRGRM